MYIKLSFKPLVLIVLLSIPIILGDVSNGYAGGPQSSAGNFEVANSKAVDGLLNAAVMADGSIFQYIVVTCKDAQAVLGPAVDAYSSSAGDLALTTAECSDSGDDLCLEGQIFGDALAVEPDSPLLDCFPDARPFVLDDLIITRVKNFINTGTTISAEVTLRLGVEIPEGP